MTHTLDVATAEAITGKNTFFEAIIAPGYVPEAIPILTERKSWGANLRLLEVASLQGWRDKAAATGLDFKRVTGGLLAQTRGSSGRYRSTTGDCHRPRAFRSRNCRTALCLAARTACQEQCDCLYQRQADRGRRRGPDESGTPLCGWPSSRRVKEARGAVMASDAFFPFPDGPEAAAAAGITAIIQPGGSKKDQETIAVCNRHNIAMVYTGIRHFLH